MCGIAGIINLDGSPVSKSVLKKMTDVIAHCGPDGEGYWIERNVAIGHRRVAIIDLSDALIDLNSKPKPTVVRAKK